MIDQFHCAVYFIGGTEQPGFMRKSAGLSVKNKSQSYFENYDVDEGPYPKLKRSLFVNKLHIFKIRKRQLTAAFLNALHFLHQQGFPTDPTFLQ